MSETALRLTVFLGLFALVALWERLSPVRAPTTPRTRRWTTNWAVAAIDSAVVQIVFGAAAIGAALDAGASGIGLFNALGWPLWLEIALTVLALDFAIWAQHYATHRIPLLWRLHKVHHSDRDMDVTTAIRFHPVEIALSMALKIGLVYALGAPAVAVLIFEVVLNGAAMFNHGNMRLPPRLERVLRWVIVTPDMHRIHHSTRRAEHDTNFGFNLSVWDRLFGTYTAEPAGGQAAMTVGLAEHQDARPTGLLWTLALPFWAR